MERQLTKRAGAIVIRGTEKQREEAWKLVKGVQATLPQLLTQIRENDIRKEKDTTWLPHNMM